MVAGRGFTGHEHLPWFNMINMNGRLYDPLVGMFLSPDNYVQSWDNSQNFNRYSYVLNNPLRYSDPSGMKLEPLPNPADAGHPYNPEAAVWLENQSYMFDYQYGNIGGGGGTYTYDWNTGNYHDANGNYVTWSEVYYSYIIPNSSSDPSEIHDFVVRNFYIGQSGASSDIQNERRSLGINIASSYIVNELYTQLAKWCSMSLTPYTENCIGLPQFVLSSALFFDNSSIDWIDYYSDSSQQLRFSYAAFSNNRPENIFYGRTPNGHYIIAQILLNHGEPGYCRDGFDFFAPLMPLFQLPDGRTGGIQIHPDGSSTNNLNNGTYGCIGLLVDRERLVNFYYSVRNYLHYYGPIDVYVNIP